MGQYYSLEDRKGMLPENFGDPGRLLFPILSQEDVDKAPKRIRRATGVADLKTRIIAIALRKGFVIPEEWADVSTEIKASIPSIDSKEVTVYAYTD